MDGDDNALAEKIATLLQNDNTNKGHPRNKKAFTIIARDGDNFLGGATAYAVWDYVLVDQIFVASQQKGTGTEIMQAVEDWARKNNKKGIYLDTGDWQAAGFYEKLGFKKAGTIPNFSQGLSLFYYVKLF